MVPSLFFLRWWVKSSPGVWNNNERLHQNNGDLRAIFDVLPSTLLNNNEQHNVLLASLTDVAELYYCQIQDLVDPSTVAYSNFTTWAQPLLNESLSSLLQRPDVASQIHVDLISQEFILELLELYASLHNRCDYSKYQIAPILHHDKARKKLQELAIHMPQHHARIAYVFIVHQDILHLKRLLQAVHQPWHYIVLHVEHYASPTFVASVQEVANGYDNVVVLQFGAIVYKTDSVSMINLRIMKWLQQDLQLQYDYHITSSGSVFPLVRDVAESLARQQRNVFLGETYYNGREVYTDQSYLLRHKRLLYTRGELKLHKRLPRPPFASSQSLLSVELEESMRYKTNSGNQAIYSYTVVQDLLASPQVIQLFVLSKYACCCCVEERNWIAALELLGYGDEAREQSSIFQVWGGVDAHCRIQMKNALLSQNASLCYRSEDATTTSSETSLVFYGNETLELLKLAKNRGILFARKFHSEDEASVSVLRAIQEEIW
jgi:hypothetical protein